MKQILNLGILWVFYSVASFSYADCYFDIEVGDYLRFSAVDMTVEKSCESISLNLVHSGKLPANVMGHNWVLTKTADVQAVAGEGMRAGLAADYVPSGDARVIAATAIIGGGENTGVTLATADLIVGEEYTYFCSFPGHSYTMRGKLIVNP